MHDDESDARGFRSGLDVNEPRLTALQLFLKSPAHRLTVGSNCVLKNPATIMVCQINIAISFSELIWCVTVDGFLHYVFTWYEDFLGATVTWWSMSRKSVDKASCSADGSRTRMMKAGLNLQRADAGKSLCCDLE